MMTGFWRSALLCMAALSAGPAAWADEMPAAACAAPATPTGELAAWATPVPLAAAGSAEHAAHAPLAVGQAATVTLLRTPAVAYPLRPEKPGGSVSYGGLIGVGIAEAGIYRVALSTGAWIDLVRDGKAVASVAHGHGPDCTGIRKMVDFPLEPGRYVLQIAANGAPDIGVLVAKLP